METIRPPATVSEMTANGRPSGSQATPPGTPLTSARVAVSANRRNDIACVATASAPRTTEASSGRALPPSERTTTSGSSTANSRSKSPSRAAARNASTTAHWPSRSVSGTGAPRTRRRARLASCRAAAVDRPTIGAISSNGNANTSCRTNATRSAGVRASRTARSARPSESPRSASCSGSIPSSGLTIGSGTCVSSGASRRVRRERSMFRHTRPTTVVSQPLRLSTSLVSVRLRRIQASCTASSASAREPSMR